LREQLGLSDEKRVRRKRSPDANPDGAFSRKLR